MVSTDTCIPSPRQGPAATTQERRRAAMYGCGGSSHAPPTLPPHTPLRQRPAGPTRTAVRRAGRWVAATIPPPAGWGAAAPSSLLSTPSRLGNDCERLLENS